MISGMLSEAHRALAEADALLITAGAGMGVDSGLPDFRGTEGFWRAYPAIAALGLRFEEMANPEWFGRDPTLAWAFYGHRLNLYRATVPHAGFALLLRMAATKRLGHFIFTSNVDGQFQRAGFPLSRIVECHGSIHHFQCLRRCTRDIMDGSSLEVRLDMEKFRAQTPLPQCPRCGGPVRPNVLMFDDGDWFPERTSAQRSALQNWLESVSRQQGRLVIIELGAGSAIPTVRLFSERTARELGGHLIRINPREAEVPSGHFSLSYGALEGLRILTSPTGAAVISPNPASE